eukprot:5069012-Lingulodinium_polyedra.AAC.1
MITRAAWVLLGCRFGAAWGADLVLLGCCLGAHLGAGMVLHGHCFRGAREACGLRAAAAADG